MVDLVGEDVARLHHEHRERLKELAAVHDVVRILRDPAASAAALIERVVARLPAAMQFPEDTRARISYGKLSRVSSERDPIATLRRSFRTTDDAGEIEIGYCSSHPEQHEGPFLAEEAALVDTVADVLGAELDRRHVTRNITDQSTKLVLAAETAELAVWEWDLADDRVSWSPDLARIVGRDISAERFAEHAQLLHPEDRERVLDTVRAAATIPDRIFELEFRVVRPDGGQRWINARGRVLAGSGGGPGRVIAILADITRRKTLEQSIVQLQKMDAMGRLASGVAHDFNNMLSVMILNAGELVEQIAPDDARFELADDIQKVAKRGTELTKQLLAFSRKTEIRPTEIDPDVVIRAAEPMLKRLVGRRVNLVLDLQSGRRVLVDATQLDQVVMNLVVNARDAMNDTGTITISTYPEHVDVEIAQLYGHVRPGTHVRITVADTGKGIPPEARARLFEPFFTTKEPGKGTGLGLAVVFGIVQQGNGFVTVESEPGQGARFHVRLPACT